MVYFLNQTLQVEKDELYETAELLGITTRLLQRRIVNRLEDYKHQIAQYDHVARRKRKYTEKISSWRNVSEFYHNNDLF